ncbi:2-amino-4-hydroxy-6-hydroxymethyldihydropteridine diphosphokinase [Ruania albidiflava]|uniref:2-amino-4-hydroxy-6- hydroxymethyldihydropteridine diphosphokinase n=1 Tax=Ruania albidiflava TaxID=366586 RepID=UPI0023EFC923|nr:2-amino-4-hydroxy-6-hydroxymethyldihydropteridine diphosphokinase [Ruania albidiflava]
MNDDTSTADGSASLDQIRLTGLGGIGYHGVLPDERRDGQPFLADLVLAVDTRAAALGDDLTRTVNYAEVAQQVVAVIEGEPVNLLETLAGRIAAVALAYEPVHAVTVTVHKPEAPVGVPFTDVEVTVTRTRADELPALGAAAPEEPVGAEAAPAVLPAAVPPAPVPEHVEPEPAEPEPAAAAGTDLHAAPDQPVPVVIALGGNIGDVRATLRAVVSDLRAMPGLTVQEVSPLARTAPVLAPDAVAQPDFLNAVVLATTTMAPMALLQAMQELENAYGRRRTVTWGERTLDLDLIVYDGVTSTDPDLSLPHPRASERAFVLVPWAQADPDAFLPGLGGGPVASLAETAPDRGGVRWLALDWLEEPVRPAPAPGPPAVPPADQSVADPADSGAGAGEAAPDVSGEAADPAGADPAAAAAAEQAGPVGAHTGTAASQESLEDLELLAHGDAEPEHAEPAAPPVRPGRASFPPAVPPEPAAAQDPDREDQAPTHDPDVDPAGAGGPDPADAGSDPQEADPHPAEEDWFDSAPGGGQDPSEPGEPDLPWAVPQEESETPRMAPKWQPLRRHTDT